MKYGRERPAGLSLDTLGEEEGRVSDRPRVTLVTSVWAPGGYRDPMVEASRLPPGAKRARKTVRELA